METYVEQVQTIACRETLLLHSDKALLDSFLSRYEYLAKPFNAIISSHIETLLSNIPFLSGVKESQLSVLAAMCRYEAVDKDKIVFEENSEGNKLYILLNGVATVIAPQWVGNATAIQQSLEWGSDRGDDKVVVADLKSGDYFGETAMFVNINRTSTVQTKEKCLFVSVEKTTFENFCAVCPIKEKMTSVMKERMVTKLSSLGIPFLMGIPGDKLKSLTDLAQIHEIEDGEVIFCEGEKGDRFYIIVHGQVKVETNYDNNEDSNAKDDGNEPKTKSPMPKIMETNQKVLGILGAGCYFGEMGLVNDAPRSATVSAMNKTILLSLGKESFQNIFASNHNALTEFTLRVLGANSELCHLLAHPLGLSTFISFLKRNLAEENIRFWIATKDFQEGFCKDDKEALEKANFIYQTYCREGADHQVNLPCSIRTQIDALLTEADETPITQDLFNTAQDEIYKLMVRDNFVRFKKTPDFNEVFKCLGILIDNQ